MIESRFLDKKDLLPIQRIIYKCYYGHEELNSKPLVRKENKSIPGYLQDIPITEQTYVDLLQYKTYCNFSEKLSGYKNLALWNGRRTAKTDLLCRIALTELKANQDKTNILYVSPNSSKSNFAKSYLFNMTVDTDLSKKENSISFPKNQSKIIFATEENVLQRAKGLDNIILILDEVSSKDLISDMYAQKNFIAGSDRHFALSERSYLENFMSSDWLCFSIPSRHLISLKGFSDQDLLDSEFRNNSFFEKIHEYPDLFQKYLEKMSLREFSSRAHGSQSKTSLYYELLDHLVSHFYCLSKE